MDFESLAEQFEQQEQPEENKPETAVAVKSEGGISAYDVVGGTQQEVLRRAQDKINSEKILEKHASKIAKITDKAMEVDAERCTQRPTSRRGKQSRKARDKKQAHCLKGGSKTLEKRTEATEPRTKSGA